MAGRWERSGQLARNARLNFQQKKTWFQSASRLLPAFEELFLHQNNEVYWYYEPNPKAKTSFALKPACFAGCAQTLSDATPPTGKNQPIQKICRNF